MVKGGLSAQEKNLSVIVIRNVVCDNPSAHRIKATLGITGLSRLIVHIDNAVWHLDRGLVGCKAYCMNLLFAGTSGYLCYE